MFLLVNKTPNIFWYANPLCKTMGGTQSLGWGWGVFYRDPPLALIYYSSIYPSQSLTYYNPISRNSPSSHTPGAHELR